MIPFIFLCTCLFLRVPKQPAYCNSGWFDCRVTECSECLASCPKSLCQASQVGLDSTSFGDYLIPRHRSVSFAGFATEDCGQRAVHAGLDSGVVILLLPNLLFKPIQISSDSIDIQILHLATAISTLVAAKRGLALEADFGKTILSVGDTIAGKTMGVPEVFTAMILDQAVVKLSNPYEIE